MKVILHPFFSIFRYQIPEDWPYQEARRLFKEPVALSDEEQLEIKWSAPDEEVNTFEVENCYIICIIPVLTLSCQST